MKSTSRWAKSSGASCRRRCRIRSGRPAFGRASKTVDVVAEQRQPVRAGEAGRPGADHGDALAGRRAARNGCRRAGDQVGRWRSAAAGRSCTGLPSAAIAHAGLLAQHLGRADAGAHAADDVALEDRAAPAPLRIAGRDLADEERDVDAGRAGLDAGRVVAEIAAARLRRAPRGGRAADAGPRNWR